MKKTLKTTLAVLMCAALLLGLCACGGSASSLKGTNWSVSKVSANGMEIEGEMLASMGFEITINFTSDSEYTMEALGESIDGTYTLSGNTLTLTVGSDSQDCTLSGNSFTMEEDGSKVVFTKK